MCKSRERNEFNKFYSFNFYLILFNLPLSLSAFNISISRFSMKLDIEYSIEKRREREKALFY